MLFVRLDYITKKLVIDQQGRILKMGKINSSFEEVGISQLMNGLYSIRIGDVNIKFIKN